MPRGVVAYDANSRSLSVEGRTVALGSVVKTAVEGSRLVLSLPDDRDPLAVECASQNEAESWLSFIQEHRPMSSRMSSIDSLASGTTTPGDLCDLDDDDDDATRSSFSSLATPPRERPRPALLPAYQKPPRVKPIAPVVDDDDGDGDDDPKKPGGSRRHCVADDHSGCTELCDFMFIGGRNVACDKQAMDKRLITHVVNMTRECQNFFEDKSQKNNSSGSGGLGMGLASSSENEKKATANERLFPPLSPGGDHHHHHHRGEDDDHDDAPFADDYSAVRHQQQQQPLHCRRRCEDPEGCEYCYLRCPCTDKADDDMGPYLDSIADFVHAARQSGGRILIHCNSGISRSSAAVLAYLVKFGFDGSGCALIDALRWLRDKRRIASPHPTYMRQLCDFEVALRGGSPSINASTYANNRYEDVDKLDPSLADPRSTAKLLGDRSPVYYPTGASRRFPSSGESNNSPRRPTSTRSSGASSSSKHHTFPKCFQDSS